MKQAFLSGCVLGLALSLSACGGGGGGISGGGGGGSGGATFNINDMHRGATTRSAPDMSSAAKMASALVSPGSGLQDKLAGPGVVLDQYGDYLLKAEPNGVRLTDPHGETLAAFNSSKINFYSKEGIDFAVFADVKAPIDFSTVDPDAKGPATEKPVGWLGKLDYASFGYWAQVWDFQGTGEGIPFKGSLTWSTDTEPDTDSGAGLFINGKTARYVTSLDNSRFTGLAAGIAEFYEMDDSGIKGSVIPLLGKATLEIKNALNGALTLEFPNFYKFTGSVDNINASGFISGAFTELTKLGSGFPVDLPATMGEYDLNRIRGQLYGVDPNTPSEAAGVWRLERESANRLIYIGGVFGVKKQP